MTETSVASAARTSPPSCASIRSARRARPAAAIRRPACRPPTSSRRCSSARCATTRRIRRIPTTIASCCRRGTPRRSSTPRGPRPGCSRARSCSKLRRIDIGSRRASDAAAVVRRRRDRLARPGHLRRDRHRAQRPPHRLRLPHLRAARRRRDGGRVGVGSGQHRRCTTSSTTCARIIDVNGARPEPGRRSSATTWTRSPRAGTRSAGTRIVVDGHDIPALLDGVRRGARDQRAARR